MFSQPQHFLILIFIFLCPFFLPLKCHSLALVPVADGYVMGEGVAAVVLKTLEAAEQDGNTVARDEAPGMPQG